MLEFTGAFAKNPARGRARSGEPKNLGPLGRAPELGPLTFEQAWELIAKTAPAGVLTSRDRLYVRVAAELLQLLSTQTAAEINPAKLARLEMMLSKLGLNPADASKVSGASPAKPKNEFDDL